MKKVVITGVTGFIGGHLAIVLLEKGVFVYGVDIDAPKFDLYKKYPNFKAVVADFSKYETLDQLIRDDIDVFYHFAFTFFFSFSY